MVKKMKKFNKKYIIIFVLLVLVGLLSQVGSFTDETSVEYDKYRTLMNEVSETIKIEYKMPYTASKSCYDANQGYFKTQFRCTMINSSTLDVRNKVDAEFLVKQLEKLALKYNNAYFKEKINLPATSAGCSSYVVINENRFGEINNTINKVGFVVNCTGTPSKSI
jgi:hypothetical protein